MVSGQAGTTKTGVPVMLTPNRPRLNATASRIGSEPLIRTLTWPVAGSKLAGKLRAPLLVHRNRKGAAALAGLEIVTTRDDRVQLIVSWASAELRNTA